MSPESSSGLKFEAPLPAAAPIPDPMVTGTTLLDRYTIVEVLASDASANQYRVAEIRACPHCGVENEGNLNHCGFCGTELPAPRTLVLLERPTPPNGATVPTSFVLGGLTYAFASDAVRDANVTRRHLTWNHSFLSDPGIARALRGDPNEDSVLALRLAVRHAQDASEIGVLMIADGVGGAAAGEVASKMAVETVAHELTAAALGSNGNERLTDENIPDTLRAAISHANRQVIEYGLARSLSLGTTLVLALVREGRLYLANVGDSRAYLFRDRALVQMTRDHSYVAELVAKGEITPDRARTHPQRNLILRSLGDPTGYEVDVFPLQAEGIELEPGDMLLLCSDGLWEMVDDETIAQVLAQPLDAAQLCAQLVSFANAAGGADNISVLVVQIQGE